MGLGPASLRSRRLPLPSAVLSPEDNDDDDVDIGGDEGKRSCRPATLIVPNASSMLSNSEGSTTTSPATVTMPSMIIRSALRLLICMLVPYDATRRESRILSASSALRVESAPLLNGQEEAAVLSIGEFPPYLATGRTLIDADRSTPPATPDNMANFCWLEWKTGRRVESNEGSRRPTADGPTTQFRKCVRSAWNSCVVD